MYYTFTPLRDVPGYPSVIILALAQEYPASPGLPRAWPGPAYGATILSRRWLPNKAVLALRPVPVIDILSVLHRLASCQQQPYAPKTYGISLAPDGASFYGMMLYVCRGGLPHPLLSFHPHLHHLPGTFFTSGHLLTADALRYSDSWGSELGRRCWRRSKRTTVQGLKTKHEHIYCIHTTCITTCANPVPWSDCHLTSLVHLSCFFFRPRSCCQTRALSHPPVRLLIQ